MSPAYANISLSVIKQKRESQNGGNKKTKHAKFFEKRTLPPDRHTYVYVYVRVRISGYECSFFGQFGVLCFLVTSVLRFTFFCLITDELFC